MFLIPQCNEIDNADLFTPFQFGGRQLATLTTTVIIAITAIIITTIMVMGMDHRVLVSLVVLNREIIFKKPI